MRLTIREYVNRCWRVLRSSDRVMQEFRSRFIGKCSPVHFFWGSFDLAVTRFSGRPAPPRPDADAITREAYSHEVISHGWWPGQGPLGKPAFYSYTAPAPEGLSEAKLRPEKALLQQRSLRVSVALRRRPHRSGSRCSVDGLPPEHLRSRRQPRPMGSRFARALNRDGGDPATEGRPYKSLMFKSPRGGF